MAADERLEDILALVRRQGARVTAPRRAIVRALLDAPEHVTAERLAEDVRRAHPEIHRSTVYRTLDTLATLGVVVHAHLGHGPAVYHLADQPHYHLVCQACGRVTQVPVSVMAGVRRRLSREFRFDLDATHFALAGRCSGCR